MFLEKKGLVGFAYELGNFVRICKPSLTKRETISFERKKKYKTSNVKEAILIL